MNDAHRKSRLHHLVATDYKGSRAAFMVDAQISKGRLSQLMGQSEPFGEEAAEGLAEKLSLPSTWFSRTLPTPKEAAKLGVNIEDGYPFGEREVVPIPSLPSAAAQRAQGDIEIRQFEMGGGMGRGRLLLDDQPGVIKSWHVDQDWLRLNVRNYTKAENLCIVTGFGPSMRPMFNPGDPLLVDRGVKSVEVDAVYFFRVADHGYIKVLQRIPTADGTLLRAKSKNTDYDPFDIDIRTMDFEVFGKVLTVWKSEQF